MADITATPPPPDRPASRAWQVGTLTYTVGGLVALFCWLLWGDFAWSMKERAIVPVAQLMLKYFKSSDTLIGILTGSLPCALAMILCPIISYRSDRHRGRWGRRIPFLLVTTPIAALAMASLALSPMLGRMLHETLGSHSPGVYVCSLIFFGFFWTIFEIGNLAASAVFGALINDVVPSHFLGRFYGLFRALSLLAGIVFNYWLLGKSDTFAAEGRVEQYFIWMFVGIGLLYGAGFIAMCLKVKEGDYPPPPPVAPAKGGRFMAATRLYFRECFSNPYYLWVFVLFALGAVSAAPINTFSLFYAKSLNLSMATYGKFIAITYVISFTLSYLLGILADRFHPLRMGMVGLFLYAVFMFLGGLFICNETTFAVAFIAHGVFAGFYITSTASLGQRLFPKANYAQFASAMSIVISIAYVIVPTLMGKILDLSGHAYRLTFFASSILAALGLLAAFVVHRKFIALGGPQQYQAPE